MERGLLARILAAKRREARARMRVACPSGSRGLCRAGARAHPAFTVVCAVLLTLLLGGCFGPRSQSPYDSLSGEARTELEKLHQDRQRFDLTKLWSAYVAFLDAHRHHVPTHRQFQDEMIEAGLRDRVREQYRVWLTEAESDSDFYHSLFLTMYARLVDDDREAIRMLERAIDIDDDNHWAWYGVGFLQHRQQVRRLAIRAYDEAIAIRPDWPLPYIQAAELEMERERFEAAASYYAGYLRLVPSDPNTLYNYARVLHLRLDRRAEAGEIYRRLITDNPGSLGLDRLIDVFNNLAHLETMDRDYTTAEALYQRILQIDSSWLEANLNLAILYEDYLEDPRKALENYRIFLEHGGPRRFPNLTNEFFVINAIDRLEKRLRGAPK